MKLLLLLSLSLLALAQTPPFARVFPGNGPKPIGPYSPGLWARDRLYVSGQGSRGDSKIACAAITLRTPVLLRGA